ncbi:MAG: 4a-hydroxytetrahydrobiopterin dehydratase [Magnetovibrio sp.]|nr:4a-hydroxytetrahydrobiopterin dehydratase [Magnetovibrio sp.]
MSSTLNASDVSAHLKQVDGWALSTDQKAIEKKFSFKNFPDAFAFMTRVAFTCEKINHHPDWSNTYNRVDVRLSTHDADGLTERDFTLAQAMDKVMDGRH